MSALSGLRLYAKFEK